MSPGRTSVDFLIVTIIPKVELDGLLSEFDIFRTHKDYKKTKLSMGVYQISFPAPHGEPYEAIVVATYDQGNVVSAIQTASFVDRYMPAFVVLCGIGGNVFPNRTKKGDVVIAKGVKYERLSKVNEGLDYEFTTPQIPQPTRAVWQKFMEFETDRPIDFYTENPEAEKAIAINSRVPIIEYGVLYCSHMVVDCSEYRTKIQRADREHRAIEMEAAGFLMAVEQYEREYSLKVPVLIARGISDESANKSLDDADKSVKWRNYAAKNAARAVVRFISQISREDWSQLR